MDSSNWMSDESRAAWAINSLKARRAEYRTASRNNRKAFAKEWLGAPANWLADCYDEIVALLDLKIAQIESHSAAITEERS